MPRFVAQRRRALQAAAELLDELEIDQEQPIDVFDSITRLGLWLVFTPLKTLLGAIVPQSDGGIMITTERQPSIQRYTAAHEIGHWELDHRTAFDTYDDVLNPAANERERLSQWFASYFLMPPPLVHATASRHLVRPDTDVSPAQAYLVARDMHVSYEAALRQMANLKVITDHQRDTLLAVPLQRAKQDLADGHRPRIGNADVWPVNGPSVQHAVEVVDVVVDDEIVIALPENHTTGYRWLDDTANARRAALRPRPEPPAFAPPASTSAPVTPRPEPPQRSRADIDAALALLPRPSRTPQDTDTQPASDDGPIEIPQASGQSDEGLLLVFDDYQPGWARISPRDAASLRRHIAGAVTGLTDFLAPNPELAQATSTGTTPALPDPAHPGAGATGRRLLGIQARAEGRFAYVLHYAATHDPRTPPAATFTVEATVQPPPAVLHRRLLMQIDLDDPQDQDNTYRDRSRNEANQSGAEPGGRDETDL